MCDPHFQPVAGIIGVGIFHIPTSDSIHQDSGNYPLENPVKADSSLGTVTQDRETEASDS